MVRRVDTLLHRAVALRLIYTLTWHHPIIIPIIRHILLLAFMDNDPLLPL